jgi:orotate phosphoribosyltransferase
MPYHEVRAHAAGLAEVLAQVYKLALFEGPQLPHRAAPGARAIRWALDLRMPLSHSEYLHPIATEMVKDLAEAGVVQVAGYGYGAYSLTGAITALGPGFSGALIRESAKTYGFRRVIEGDLQRDKRVIVVDDLLINGRSALLAAEALRNEGFSVTGVFTIFRLAGCPGRRALRQAGLGHRCLATLCRIPAPPR